MNEKRRPDLISISSRRSWKNFIVKKRYQFKLIGGILVFFLFTTLSLWAGGKIILNYMADHFFVHDLGAIQKVDWILNIYFFLSIVVLFVNSLIGVGLSHLFAGPIYRFEKEFEKLKMGDVSGKLTIRKYDELQDTADTYNEALDGLRQTILKEHESLRQSVNRIEVALKENPEMTSRIKEIKEFPKYLKI